ncbi:hypothetical protein C8R42DRAFT_643658 [Lentinula raphanica]|nr:hypothetical protein C8R42DRAFT_643658 [Lentinula raphanica]
MTSQGRLRCDSQDINDRQKQAEKEGTPTQLYASTASFGQASDWCKIDLRYWYLANPDGPPPHPSDDAYTNPATLRPPSDFIQHSAISPQFHDISSGYRARESFARLVLPVYAASLEANSEDAFLDDLVTKWLYFFPDDLLPSNNNQYSLESERLTVAYMPVSMKQYIADLEERCKLQSLPNSPEKQAEGEALLQSTLLKWKMSGACRLNRIHAGFDEDLPRSFFLELLKDAIQKCLKRGLHVCTLPVASTPLDWNEGLEKAFLHWFYHQRLPLSFQILYALPAYTPFCDTMLDIPDSFFWRPPYIPRDPSILWTSDSECATTAKNDMSEVSHISISRAGAEQLEGAGSEM